MVLEGRTQQFGSQLEKSQSIHAVVTSSPSLHLKPTLLELVQAIPCKVAIPL